MFKSKVLKTTAAVALLLATSQASKQDDFFLSSPTSDISGINTLPEVDIVNLPIKKTVASDRNIYTVSLRFGSTPSQTAELVLATNSEWTMVTSVNCTVDFGCKHGAYDASKSTSEHIDDDNNRLTSASIGVDYYFSGYNGTDVLYLMDGITQIDPKYPFFIIETVGDKNFKAGPVFPYDGILGLSPDIDSDTVLTLGVPLPLHLKRTGKIKKAIAAIDMHNDGTQSSIVFGKYDTSKFRDKSEKESELKWFQIPKGASKFSWRHEMKNVFYNMKSFDDGYRNDAIFDSFSGGVHIPVSEWVPMFKEIQANLTAVEKTFLECDYDNYACQYTTECRFHSSNFKSLHFNFIEDRGYEIKPEVYLQDTVNDKGLNICKVAIYGNRQNASEYILGDVFMTGLYVILDYENSMFTVNGPYVVVRPIDDKPDRPTDTGNNMVWIIIGSVVGVLVLVAIVGFIIVRQKNRRLQANLSKYETL